MGDYRVSKRAEVDLFELFVFGHERFGAKQAESYAAGLASAFQLLADNPRMGRKVDVIAPGVLRHEHGSHVILYEVASNGVLILAVIHASSVRRLSL